jgi:hypothetical protein
MACHLKAWRGDAIDVRKAGAQLKNVAAILTQKMVVMTRTLAFIAGRLTGDFHHGDKILG